MKRGSCEMARRASYPGLEIIAKLATVLEVEPAELMRVGAEYKAQHLICRSLPR